MYENYIKWLNYKLQELIIAERMRSIGEVNVENQVPYRCHIICHMNRFMVKFLTGAPHPFFLQLISHPGD